MKTELRTLTRFEEEADMNSQMSYSIDSNFKLVRLVAWPVYEGATESDYHPRIFNTVF